jgi:glutathione S-transferase
MRARLARGVLASTPQRETPSPRSRRARARPWGHHKHDLPANQSIGRRDRICAPHAQRDAEAALAEPLDVYRAFFLGPKPFIGGASPSIADIRLAATLEFLRAIDYDFPGWANEYMTRMEASLGEAYSEPAADVRGYIAHVKSQNG